MKKALVYIILFSILSIAQADNNNYTDSFRKKKFIGFNINPLLSQITPFNNIRQGITEPSIIFRTYNKSYGSRIAIGINTDINTMDLIAFSFSAGLTKRKKLYNNFYWIGGFEFRTRAINRNLNTGGTTTLGNEFVGIANVWGIEYQLNNALSVSTETALELGASLGVNSQPVLSLRPPFSLQLHLFIPRK
jgi:hypothetical protein